MFGLQFGLGLGARRAPATPEGPLTIFSADPALDADDNNPNTTFRVVCTITDAAQTHLRITLAPGTTNALTVIGCGFGKRDESEPNYSNTLATPVEVLFGGQSGFANATTIQVSDWTPCSDLGLVNGDQVVVTYTTGGSGQASTRLNASATNADTYYQTGTHWDVTNTIGLGFNTLEGRNYAVVSIETRNGIDPGDIPMSLDDARFLGNAAGSGSIVTNATYANKDWDDNPSYTSAVPCFVWEGDGADLLTMSQCRVDFREGPRIGAGSTPLATLNIDETFINCVGKTGDHADGLQAYSPGGQALVEISNTCFRSYTDDEAVSKYGAGFIGSQAIFVADNFGGEFRLTNVLVWGGARGIAIYADTGTTIRISFENVYFVPSPDGWTYFDYDIRAAGGTLIVDKWVNVRAATIVDGIIVPGAWLPSP